MCSMISWDIFLRSLVRIGVDQVPADDCVVRDLDVVVARLDDDGTLAGAHDLALEALALRRAKRDRLAEGIAEVLGPAQWALDPGRGDLDGVLAQVVAQRVGDARA